MTGLGAFLGTGAARTLGWTLLHTLWQAAVVAAVVALLLRLIPRRLPELRYRFAAGGLVLVALGAALTGAALAVDWREHAACWAMVEEPGALRGTHAARCADHGVFQKERRDEEGGEAAATAAAAGESRDPVALTRDAALALTPAAGWAAALWALGLLLAGWRLARDLLAARRVRLDARPVEAGAARAALSRAADRVDVRRPVGIAVTGDVDSPCVLGAGRPVVLVPPWAIEALDDEDLELLLAHELAHVRRRDYAANLVQRGVEAALFFNPFARWLSKAVREEREARCDRDAAGRSAGGCRRYVAALCRVERLRPGRRSAVAGVGLGDAPRLLARARRLVEANRDSRSRRLPRTLAAAVVALSAALGWVDATEFGARMTSFSVMVVDLRHREPVPRPPPPPPLAATGAGAAADGRPAGPRASGSGRATAH